MITCKLYIIQYMSFWFAKNKIIKLLYLISKLIFSWIIAWNRTDEKESLFKSDALVSDMTSDEISQLKI